MSWAMRRDRLAGNNTARNMSMSPPGFGFSALQGGRGTEAEASTQKFPSASSAIWLERRAADALDRIEAIQAGGTPNRAMKSPVQPGPVVFEIWRLGAGCDPDGAVAPMATR